MKKVIDCYGWPSSSEFFMHKKKNAFEVRSVGTKTYIRFDNADKCAIWCIDESAGQKIAWAFGVWADRESLTYDLDLNQPLTIEVEE